MRPPDEMQQPPWQGRSSGERERGLEATIARLHACPKRTRNIVHGKLATSREFARGTAMTGRVNRWRHCPACLLVRVAGTFTVLNHRASMWNDTAKRGRRCPSCGHTGPGWTFKTAAPEVR